jgi:hypothetical protein
MGALVKVEDAYAWFAKLWSIRGGYHKQENPIGQWAKPNDAQAQLCTRFVKHQKRWPLVVLPSRSAPSGAIPEVVKEVLAILGRVTRLATCSTRTTETGKEATKYHGSSLAPAGLPNNLHWSARAHSLGASSSGHPTGSLADAGASLTFCMQCVMIGFRA